MITRRALLETAGAGAAMVATGLAVPKSMQAQAAVPNMPSELLAGVRSEAVMETLPGKKPLIKLSYRPPNYEAPIQYLRTAITPNDEFFVRYHLSNIPEIDPKEWKLEVGGGDGSNGQATLSLADLKAMPAVEVVAVNQCSGNRRGLFHPHVAGVQWGYGAMGCARWKGAKLKDILDKAGIKKEAIEVVLEGADGPAVDTTPDFAKSIPVWKALEDTTIVAYEMNGEPLPHLNGAPARLIVPGWTGTYWMKHITTVKPITKPYDGFWVKGAYRVPTGMFPLVARFISQETAANTPITEMVINSLITSHVNGASVREGRTFTVGGIAWDGGYGITTVEVSTDGGKTWGEAKLGEDLGKYAFRTFNAPVSFKSKGKHTVMAKATNKIGQTQTSALLFNGAGYHHNLISTLTLSVS
jgi:DMSO/TMAO reductase YedYZ molybdopterin-dependent catalytic subunit